MTSIITAGDYSDSLDWEAPIDGLEYAGFYFGGDSVLSRNLVRGKAAGVPTGASLVAAGTYAQFAGTSGYIQTDVAEATAMTYLSVVRIANPALQTGSGRSIVIGNYNNATTPATTLFGSSSLQYSAGTSSGSPSAVTTAALNATMTDWQMVVLRSTATNIRQTNLTALTDNTVTLATSPRVITAANRIRIGAGVSTSLNGICQQAFAAIALGALSDTDLATFAATVRKMCSRAGITV